MTTNPSRAQLISWLSLLSKAMYNVRAAVSPGEAGEIARNVLCVVPDWRVIAHFDEAEPGPPAAVIVPGPRCPGHGGPGPHGEPCCDRAGTYNGFGSDGPLLFTCPKDCSCHD